jgi:hypothetical protein
MRDRALLFTMFAGAALVACGGLVRSTTTDSVDGSVDSTRPTLDAGVDVDASRADTEASSTTCDAADAPTIFPGCPADAPSIGDPCTTEDLVCEYGPSWWVACNALLKCKAGSWQKDPFSAAAPCDDGQPDDGGPCPATWAEASVIEAGLFCPAADCQYPEGYCECVSHCGGGGGRKKPEMLMGDWRCQPATPECPSPRPLLGTACDEHDAGTCMYSWPCGCGQNQSCQDGVWQGYPSPPCP